MGLAYFIFKESYDYSIAEFMCFGLVIIICITSISGNAKMLSRKKVNFKLENILLVLIILIGVYILGCTYTNKFGMVANQFLSQYYAFVYFVFILLIAFIQPFILCFLFINKTIVVGIAIANIIADTDINTNHKRFTKKSTKRTAFPLGRIIVYKNEWMLF